MNVRTSVKAVVGLVAGTLAVVMATTALAGDRSQTWSDVASSFQSQSWYANGTGNHSFYRYTCSDNHPAYTWTTFTLYHQRGGLPDENKGAMVYQRGCNGTNVNGSAYSGDTQNHYWKVTYNVAAGYHRISGSGRQYYP